MLSRHALSVVVFKFTFVEAQKHKNDCDVF